MSRSLFGYHCHELPIVLMSSERVENLLYVSTNWEVVENYDMEHILPRVGGTAFALFLSTLNSMHDKSLGHQCVRSELQFLNAWFSDMKTTLEIH